MDKVIPPSLPEIELEQLVNNSPTIIFVWLPAETWQVAFVSSNINNLGYSPQEFYAGTITFPQLMHPDDRAGIMADADDLLKSTKSDFSQRYRLKTRSGVTLWVMTKTHLIRDEAGRVTQIQSVISDISEVMQANQRAMQFLQATGNLFLELDRQGLVLGINDRTEEITGADRKELIGCNWFEKFVPSDIRPQIIETFEQLMSGRVDSVVSEYETDIVSRNKGRRTIHWYALLNRDNDGNPQTLIVFGGDVTRLRHTQHELELLAELPLQNPNPLMRINRDGDVELANVAAQILLEELANDPSGYAAWSEILEKACFADRNTTHEIDFSQHSFLFNIVPIPDSEHVNIYGANITELRRFQSTIEAMAYQDALTGIPNRAMLIPRIQQLLANLHRSGQKFALMMLDLDHFKDINDLMGHSAGDKLLVEIARRLSAAIRETDTVARFGGDEFVILQTDVREIADTRTLARKILATVNEPWSIQNQEVIIGTSIGVVLATDFNTPPELLLQQADIALYEAKRTERGSCQIHSRELGNATTYRLALSRKLAGSLQKNEFSLVYQPQIRLADMSITGCEALLRWHNSEYGNISPEVFIPIAETHGYIHQIGEWVLEQALQQFSRWQNEGLSVPRVAVNLATVQLKRKDFANTVAKLLQTFPATGEALELEITESIYLTMDKVIRNNITMLRGLGVGLALDDFGTGYSSLSYLHKLPLRKLKIAQELIKDMDRNEDYFEIVSATIAMAKKLRLETVAEGVETRELLATLVDLKCEVVQGYYLGKPMAPSDFREFVLNWQAGEHPMS